LIIREKLKELIERHLFSLLRQSSYEVVTMTARELLVHTRFDIAVKLLYLEVKGKNPKFAEKIYKEHIKAFSLGTYTEIGNKNKNSIFKFINEFDNIFQSIRLGGFDKSVTLLPLSRNGVLLNGSHRVASAIYLNENVACVQTEIDNPTYDYKFFQKRHMPNDSLDAAAIKFIEYANNVYLAFIWPSAQGFDEEVESIIPNIFYRKSVQLSLNGAHNLISQIYYGENWLGSASDNFKGSKEQVERCFSTSDSIRVVAFQAESLDEAIKVKERIREVFDIGKGSIHTTDTAEEAVKISRIIFNDNGVHFLNHAKPNKYLSVYEKIKKIKEFTIKNQFDLSDIAVDGGMVLSVYGLREAGDIDYLSNNSAKYSSKAIECNDDQLKHHAQDKIELIFNPKNYFYFNDVKFISFDKVYQMKKKRGCKRDVNDCQIMRSLVEKNNFEAYINRCRHNVFYMKILLKTGFLHFLKNIGLYRISRWTYRRCLSR
jgi:hypothetical protein